MSLPAVNKPKFFSTKLLSRPEVEVKFRALRGNEEREFLTAAETGDQDQIESAIYGILDACVDTDGKGVKRFLAPVDMQMLLMKIRKYSHGESMDFTWECPHCGKKNEAAADLDNDVEYKERGEPRFSCAGYTFTMKVPVIESVLTTQKLSKVNQGYTLVAMSIESIIDNGDNTVYDSFNTAEVSDWLGELDAAEEREVVEEVQSRLPFVKMMKKVACRNDKCEHRGEVQDVVVEDFKPFFG